MTAQKNLPSVPSQILEMTNKTSQNHCIYLFIINFYWSIVASQCCIRFCCTAKWINCIYTYIPSFLDFLLVQVTTEHWIEFPLLYSRFSLVIYFIHSRVYIGEGNGNPLQYFRLENPTDGGAWWAAVHGVATERLHFHFSLSFIGVGNGNPCQCSCLENPRDGGAQWAAIYGVTQSRTRLKWLSSSSMQLCYKVIKRKAGLMKACWSVYFLCRS